MNKSYMQRINDAKSAINHADCIIIGGGAGLSAAGLSYTGERFTNHFGPFIDKYGFSDLYTSSFYPFKTQEEKWGYRSRHIHLNRYATGPTKLYRELYRLVSKKAHHVITTNVESQFRKSRIFNIEYFRSSRKLQLSSMCPRLPYK